MRQFVLLPVVLLFFAGLASASITFTGCNSSGIFSNLESPNTGPNDSPVCTATADSGFYISSVTLTITSDYTGYQSGSPVVTSSYTFVENTPGLPGSIPNGVVNTSGTNSVPVENYDQNVLGNFGSFVSVELAMTNVVTGGVVTGASGVYVLSASETSNSGTPEPATLGIVGTALVGLGFIARKKKKA